MMSAHTPGPWHSSHTSANSWNMGVYDEAGTEVARVSVKSALYQQRRIADARLIAAAPKLLAALQAIVALDDGDNPALWPFAELFDQARAALAKSKGETT